MSVTSSPMQVLRALSAESFCSRWVRTSEASSRIDPPTLAAAHCFMAIFIKPADFVFTAACKASLASSWRGSNSFRNLSASSRTTRSKPMVRACCSAFSISSIVPLLIASRRAACAVSFFIPNTTALEASSSASWPTPAALANLRASWSLPTSPVPIAALSSRLACSRQACASITSSTSLSCIVPAMTALISTCLASKSLDCNIVGLPKVGAFCIPRAVAAFKSVMSFSWIAPLNLRSNKITALSRNLSRS
mmetsp:Transcript_122318/g.305311  ORF Transcript_122318/g.305311 Transcript_122318/m.305311 type:complete len:251 (-) Transcript_122318:158-910(-)